MGLRSPGTPPAILLLGLLAAIAQGGCDRQAPETANAPDRFEEIRAHVQLWLSETDEAELLISVEELKETIVDDWAGQQDRYRIVSVRRPEHYAAGHIPHAVNVSWREIVKERAFDQFDPAKTTVAYCYIGHGSMLACTTLNLLGRPCRSVHFGMMGWNAAALEGDPWDGEADYAVESTANAPGESYLPPVITSDEPDLPGLVAEQAGIFLSREGPLILSSSEVKAIVDDWASKESEYQIVDVRSADEYASGHVPHALHVPWRDIAEIDSLTKLDPGRTAIVYSENGQTGLLAATALNLLGYRAVAMRFGMMDWNAGQVAASRLWPGPADYPIEVAP